MRAALIALILMTAPDGAWAGNDPPERFQGPYTRGTLYLTEVAPEQANEACNALFDKYNPRWNLPEFQDPTTRGCAVPHLDPRGPEYSWCRVIHGGDLDTIIHEVAHCNGWSEKHED